MYVCNSIDRAFLNRPYCASLLAWSSMKDPREMRSEKFLDSRSSQDQLIFDIVISGNARHSPLVHKHIPT